MKKSEVPAMRLIRLEEDMAKYKPADPKLDADNIRSFVQSFLDGKLKVTYVDLYFSRRLILSLFKFPSSYSKSNIYFSSAATPAVSGPSRGLG